jgi:hypothetical protein
MDCPHVSDAKHRKHSKWVRFIASISASEELSGHPESVGNRHCQKEAAVSRLCGSGAVAGEMVCTRCGYKRMETRHLC